MAPELGLGRIARDDDDRDGRGRFGGLGLVHERLDELERGRGGSAGGERGSPCRWGGGGCVRERCGGV